MKLIPIREKSIAPTKLCVMVHEQTLEYYKIIGYNEPWISYYFQVADNIVGICSFKGKPDSANRVEIAYWTFEQYQGKGYGSKMCAMLLEITNAYDELTVFAQTMPEVNASTTILTKNGFLRTGSATDSDVGEVWEWVWKKPTQTVHSVSQTEE